MEIKKIPTRPNELYPETQSVLGLNAFRGGTSASRAQMNANNLGQLVVVNGISERHIQTGLESANYINTTFSVKMPRDGKILQIIPRYNDKKEGLNTIRENPQTVVIYEATDGSGEIGMINLVNHCSYHPYIGFNYVKTPAFYKLSVGEWFPKGTIFLDSPGVSAERVEGDPETREYSYGVMANVVMMSHPATSEDGILIRRGALEKFAFRTYEKRIVEFGSNEFPLNTYGIDENDYKIHPEIGEYIRPDGLLMATRSYNKKLAAVEQSKHACRRIDFTFDKCVYVNGGGGRVVDIIVHHDVNTGQAGTPPTMEQQTLKYDDARREFYDAIYRLNIKMEQRFGDRLNMSNDLHRLCVEAISVVGPAETRAQKVNKKVPLDDWRIEFIIEYVNIPNIGNKFTDDYGGKGVVCSIGEDWQMPVDADGNVADFVFDPGSTVNRMIVSRLYEQYFNAASRDVLKKVIEILGVDRTRRVTQLTPDLFAIKQNDPARFDQAWQYLLGYYKLVVPQQAEWLEKEMYGMSAMTHLVHVISDGYLVLHIRTDHAPEYKNMVADVEKYYPPLYGPVSYIGNSGQRVTTRRNMRIAPMHILMLEKIADSWSAVASARRQHYGVLATMSNADKHSQPIRHNPTRAFGESEVRILVSYAGSRVAAEILDRNNNVATHTAIVKNILNAKHPTNIDNAVDRNKVPLGGSKPLLLAKHILSCSGMAFAYKPYEPTYKVA